MQLVYSTDVSKSQIPSSGISHSFHCNALEMDHYKIVSKFTGLHLHTY